jgi:exonuclease III
MAIKYHALVQLVNSFRETCRKPCLSASVLGRLKHLNIRKQQRGNRAGANYQRFIKTCINNRYCLSETLRQGVNNSNLKNVCVDKIACDSGTVHGVGLNRADEFETQSGSFGSSFDSSSNIPVIITYRSGNDMSCEKGKCDSVTENLVIVKPEKRSITNVNEKLSVGYLNARSVKNKSHEVAEFIIENKLDVCAITETWLGRGDQDEIVEREITPPGYSMAHVPRNKGKGGGVAVILKESFTTKREKNTVFKSFELIELTLRTSRDCFRLGVVYRPPSSGKSGQPVSVFFKDFQDYVGNHAASAGKLLIVGDFNLHMENQSNRDANQFRELIFSLNLQQHVKTPTHDHGHTLDLVITRDSESLIEAIHTHPAVMSDHNPLTFSFKTKKPEPLRKSISYRKLKDVDPEQFGNDIQSSSLITHPAAELDDLVDQYNKELSCILNDHAPLQAKQVTLKLNTPWYTEDILHAKRKRRKAERQWLSTGLTIHLEILRAERVEMNRLCAAAKSKYYQDSISACAKDQKSLFKLVDHLLHKQKDMKLPTYTSADSLVNTFAQFFTDKIHVIRESFASPIFSPDPNHKHTTNMPSFQPISSEKLKKIITSGNSKSCILDPIPTTLLKDHIDHLLPTLLSIVNQSLTSGTFPASLKAAIVSPLLKKSSLDKEIYKHYRPVSNLPYLGKLIERVVVEQLNVYRSENNLLEPCQSAYRKAHSTETALLKIVNDMLSAIDAKKCVLLVLLDLSAAFDTVNHDLLIHRLEEVSGITGGVLAWMQSYLTGRTQSVVIDGTSSAPHSLSVGLPQGSNIGPSEFPTYSSPLFQIAHKHEIEIHMYADDTQLYLSFDPSDYQDAVSRLEACLFEMKVWLADNHLKLNEEKTEFMVIGQKANVQKLPSPHEIQVGDATISASEKAKNIGAVIDTQLNMVSHVNHISKSCYVHLRSIGRIRPNLTEDAAATLVHSFISSKLDNANSLLYGIPEKVMTKLQVIQNNAARIVTCSQKFDHITPILKKLHWLPVKFRIKYKICLMTFKCLHGRAPSYLSEMLSSYVPSRELRSGNQCLLKEKCARLKTVGDRSFQVAAPYLWNRLPYDLRNCEALEPFKKGLKAHFFSLAYM